MISNYLKSIKFKIQENTIAVKVFLNYYIFTILSAIVSIASISYLTHNLPESDYGYLGIFSGIVYFIPSLLSFNSIGLASINIVQLNNEDYIYFRNSLINFGVLIFLIFQIILLILSAKFNNYVQLSQYSLVYGFLLFLSTIHNTELIQNKNATQFGILSFINSLLSFFISYILISKYNFNWQGRVLSFIIAEFLLILIRFIILSDIFSLYKFEIKIDEWKSLIKFGLPLWLGVFSGWVINQSDRFVLLNTFTIKEVGIYTAATGLAGFISTINNTMVKVLTPNIFIAIRDKNKKEIEKYFSFYLILISIISFLACLFSIFLLHYIFGDKYLGAKWVICILIIAQSSFGMYQIVGLVLEYLKMNHLRSVIVTFCAILSITTSILLIPYCGIMSPAIGALISFSILAFVTFIFVKKILKNFQNVI